MIKTYTKGALKGHTYDFGNLPKEKIRDLENAFASNALEGLDNPKTSQYIIDLVKKGYTSNQIIEELNYQVKNNLDAFLAQFD